MVHLKSDTEGLPSKLQITMHTAEPCRASEVTFKEIQGTGAAGRQDDWCWKKHGGSIDLGGLNNGRYWHHAPCVRLSDTLMLFDLNTRHSEELRDTDKAEILLICSAVWWHYKRLPEASSFPRRWTDNTIMKPHVDPVTTGAGQSQYSLQRISWWTGSRPEAFSLLFPIHLNQVSCVIPHYWIWCILSYSWAIHNSFAVK